MRMEMPQLTNVNARHSRRPDNSVRWLCGRRSWLDRDQKGTPMMTKIHTLMATPAVVAVTVQYKILGEKPSATLKVWGPD